MPLSKHIFAEVWTHPSLAGLVKSSRAIFDFNDECLLLFVGPAAAAIAVIRESGWLSLFFFNGVWPLFIKRLLTYLLTHYVLVWSCKQRTASNSSWLLTLCAVCIIIKWFITASAEMCETAQYVKDKSGVRSPAEMISIQGANYKKILRLSYDVIITYDNRKSNLR